MEPNSVEDVDDNVGVDSREDDGVLDESVKVKVMTDLKPFENAGGSTEYMCVWYVQVNAAMIVAPILHSISYNQT